MEFRADYVLNVDEGGVYEQILDISETGANAIFVCVRGADVLRYSIQAVRREGTVAIVGFPKPTELGPTYWLTKHLRIIGCDPMERYNMQVMRLME